MCVDVYIFDMGIDSIFENEAFILTAMVNLGAFRKGKITDLTSLILSANCRLATRSTKPDSGFTGRKEVELITTSGNF